MLYRQERSHRFTSLTAFMRKIRDILKVVQQDESWRTVVVQSKHILGVLLALNYYIYICVWFSLSTMWVSCKRIIETELAVAMLRMTSHFDHVSPSTLSWRIAGPVGSCRIDICTRSFVDFSGIGINFPAIGCCDCAVLTGWTNREGCQLPSQLLGSIDKTHQSTFVPAAEGIEKTVT